MTSGVGVHDSRLSRRAVIAVVVMGLVCAVGAIGAAYSVLSNAEPRYRAETQVALLPARNTPAVDLSNYWEALSRGQAARIGAEVLGQRRWLAPAAQAVGVPVDSIRLSAGAVADTTLIDVSLEAGSAEAAEVALDTAVREATPVVEDVSGPFALEVVQSAEGSAEQLGAAGRQLLAVVGAAGLMIGSGIALMIARRIARRRGGIAASGAAVDRRDDHDPDPDHGLMSLPTAALPAVESTPVGKTNGVAVAAGAHTRDSRNGQPPRPAPGPRDRPSPP